MLRAPPGNRLQQLRGDRRGQHSIRINDQWRVCFVWTGGDVRTWLNLQTAYDLKVAERTIAAKIAKDIAPMAA